MSSFKEIKKKTNIKVWENKIKRLYACENLTEDDLKYINVQFDFYTLRKTYTYPIAFAVGGVAYNFYIIKDLHKYKRSFITLAFGYFAYTSIRVKNRSHYESIINPYFEKYNIK